MSVADLMAEQLARPSGPLALLAAVMLNQRNRGLIERSIASLDVRPGQKVLDVGFGGAVSLDLLTRQVGHGHVVGIDPSAEMVERAGRVLMRQVTDGRLTVEVGWAEAIPFTDDAFDRVLTSQTVYFWSDVKSGLLEIYRVLRPAGRLAVAMMPRAHQEHHGFHGRGCNVLSHDDLMSGMEDAGFVDVKPWPSASHYSCWIVVAKKPGYSAA